MTKRTEGSQAKGFARQSHTRKSIRLINDRIDRLLTRVRRLERHSALDPGQDDTGASQAPTVNSDRTEGRV